MNDKATIPGQIKGEAVNVEDSARFSTVEDAHAFFLVVKKRLQQVNNWGKMAGALSADFQLTDEKGKDIDTQPQQGNFFKINIPAPGIVSGDGADWVRVEAVEEQTTEKASFFSMRVRPTSSPANNEKDVAHFYTDDATSNFIVRQEETKVTAGVYGRNETPNVESETWIDKARNAIVGSGAVAVFSKLQWKALVNGLLQKED